MPPSRKKKMTPEQKLIFDHLIAMGMHESLVAEAVSLNLDADRAFEFCDDANVREQERLDHSTAAKLGRGREGSRSQGAASGSHINMTCSSKELNRLIGNTTMGPKTSLPRFLQKDANTEDEGGQAASTPGQRSRSRSGGRPTLGAQKSRHMRSSIHSETTPHTSTEVDYMCARLRRMCCTVCNEAIWKSGRRQRRIA